MTATTEDITIERREGDVRSFGVGNGETLYLGTLINRDADGYVVDGVDEASVKFAGVAMENVDNSSGADGAESIDLKVKGVFAFEVQSTLDEDDIGKKVYLKDNQTVGLASECTNDIYIGRVFDVVDSQAYIEINIPVAELVQQLASVADGEGASMLGIEDDGSYYTATDVEEALQEIFSAAIGGTDSGTRAYTEENVATADETLFASIEAIDLYLGDLASTANGEGASLIGVEDPDDLLVGGDAEAALVELADRMCTAVIAAADVGGGGTTTTMEVTLSSLGAAALARAAVILILCSDTQYGGRDDLNTNVTFSAATKGSILASGSGWCVAKSSAAGEFDCTLTNASDETVYLSAATPNGGVDALAAGVLLVGCVPDDVTWAA